MAKLSDSQLLVLSAACQRADYAVFPVDPKLKGIAANNVLKSLLNKGLIREAQAKHADTVWREDKKRGRLTLRTTPAAYQALGRGPAEASAEAAAETNEAPATTNRGARRSRKAAAVSEKPRRSRAGSKQAKLIAMLKRPEGATIEEIAKKLDWQQHTVRGAIAGALKKKLALDVRSNKVDARGRVYRLNG